MSLQEEVEVLRRIPLFQRIEPTKLKLLAFTSERVTFGPDEEIMRQGDIGDAAYIIIEGAADVIIETDSGPITVASVGRNDIIGEIAILIDVPRTATIRTKEQVTTLRISKDLFFRLISEFPQMAVEIMRELATRLERTTAQLRQSMAENKT